MENELAEVLPASDVGLNLDRPQDRMSDEVARLLGDLESRLIAANLRTEAVQAGMVDLDGLRLIDPSAIRLGSDDRVIDGAKLMDDLRRSKPWLFGRLSSSSAATVPASQPIRQKMAIEMSAEEYAAARAAITKYRF